METDRTAYRELVARVTVSQRRFARGDLPDVCAKTGAPADASWPVGATYQPGWVWILLPFGVVGFLVASWFTTQRLDGLVPLSEAATRRIVRATQVRAVSLIAGIILIGLSIVFQAEPVAVAGIVLVVVASAVTLVGLWLFVGARWDPFGDTVTLKRVHPAFVEAATRR